MGLKVIKTEEEKETYCCRNMSTPDFWPFPGEPKIRKFWMKVFIQQHIWALEISVYYLCHYRRKIKVNLSVMDALKNEKLHQKMLCYYIIFPASSSNWEDMVPELPILHADKPIPGLLQVLYGVLFSRRVVVAPCWTDDLPSFCLAYTHKQAVFEFLLIHPQHSILWVWQDLDAPQYQEIELQPATAYGPMCKINPVCKKITSFRNLLSHPKETAWKLYFYSISMSVPF